MQRPGLPPPAPFYPGGYPPPPGWPGYPMPFVPVQGYGAPPGAYPQPGGYPPAGYPQQHGHAPPQAGYAVHDKSKKKSSKKGILYLSRSPCHCLSWFPC